MNVFERCDRAANSCYNRGLRLAKQRDLSGAVPYLKRALELNKNLIEARNLLGLIFYEMGEVGDALVQWVISIDLRTENNRAVFYLDDVRRRGGQLESFAAMIERYNVALDAAQRGNYDLAIHQLARIVAQHPNYVRAGLLLSLLYIEAGDYKRADHYLRLVRKTDRMNQTAVRYADAAEQEKRRIQKKQDKPREEIDNGSRTYSHREMSDDEVLIPSTYRESTGWQTALNIGIGLLIGAAAIVFLYMPTKRAELNSQHNAEIRELNRKLASANSAVRDSEQNHSSAEEEKNALQAEVDMLTDGANSKISQYQKLVGIVNDIRNNDFARAAELYATLDVSQLTDIDDGSGVSVTEIYQSIAGRMNSEGYLSLYSRAEVQYQAGNYRGAIDLYDKSLAINPNYAPALFRKAMAYKELGDNDTANSFFEEVGTRFPGTELARQAESEKIR